MLVQTPASEQAVRWNQGPSANQGFEDQAEGPVRGSAWAGAAGRRGKKKVTFKKKKGSSCSSVTLTGVESLAFPQDSDLGFTEFVPECGCVSDFLP